MPEVQFVTPLHVSSKRDYHARMNPDKPACMRVAKQFGHDYWDGDRKYGYGGYRDDGRWKSVSSHLFSHYNLRAGDNVLDIGCGKGYLITELNRLQCDVHGCDISGYAVANTRYVKEDCKKLGWSNDFFDFIYSINVFHNLGYKGLKQAIREMVRVSKEKMYICVESYRNEEELCNLQCWALTCQSFYTPDDWLQIYEDNGYIGDYEFIYFT